MEARKLTLSKSDKQVNRGLVVTTGRTLALSSFVNGQGNLHEYLSRFEMYADVAEWDKRIWATTLSRLSRGKAVESYNKLFPEEAMDCNCLKLLCW